MEHAENIKLKKTTHTHTHIEIVFMGTHIRGSLRTHRL